MPVLSYGRSDKYDKPIQRSRGSSPIPSSQRRGSSSGNIFNFLNPRSRQNSESAPDSSLRNNSPSSDIDLDPPEPNTSTPSYETTTSIQGSPDVDISEYCMGKPKKVAQSHSGSVKVYVCMQEDALFLPTVKNRRSHRHRRRRNTSPPSSHANTGASAFASSNPPPPRANSTLVDDLYTAQNHEDEDVSDDMDDTVGPTNERSSETTTSANGDASVTVARNRNEPNLHDGSAIRDISGNFGTESSENGSANSSANHSESSTRNPSANTSTNASANVSTNSINTNTNSDAFVAAAGDEVVTGSTPSAAASSTGSELPAYTPESTSSSYATLRGSVLLELTKPTKIKEIGVSFYCMSSTLWNLLPQSSLLNDHAYHNSAQVEDMAYLGIHHWDFVPLEQFGPAQASYDKVCGNHSGTLIGQDLYGADVAVFKSDPGNLRQREFTRLANSSSSTVRTQNTNSVPVFGSLKTQPRKMRQSSVHVDGITFPPGSYVYNFTLLVDAKTPGSAHLSNGQVKFAVGAKVYRTGPFTMNVSGSLGVEVVHIPTDFTGEYSGPQNDQVLLTRIWENMFMYYINLGRRSIALDSPTKLSITLFPMDRLDVKIHQVQVYINEISTYTYSMDSTIKYVDPTLRLLLAQKTAKKRPKDSKSACGGNRCRADGTATGSSSPIPLETNGTGTPEETGDNSVSPDMGLLDLNNPQQIDLDFVLASEHNNNLANISSQAYKRGRYGELRFLAPDVKGPYVRVKHRLQVIFHVSHGNGIGSTNDSHRHHYEVKFETRVHVLSRHCVPASISLPSYSAAPANTDPSSHGTAIPEVLDEQLPPLPSFDDAMDHTLLGASGRLTMRRSKAVIEDIAEAQE